MKMKAQGRPSANRLMCFTVVLPTSWHRPESRLPSGPNHYDGFSTCLDLSGPRQDFSFIVSELAS